MLAFFLAGSAGYFCRSKSILLQGAGTRHRLLHPRSLDECSVALNRSVMGRRASLRICSSVTSFFQVLRRSFEQHPVLATGGRGPLQLLSRWAVSISSRRWICFTRDWICSSFVTPTIPEMNRASARCFCPPAYSIVGGFTTILTFGRYVRHLRPPRELLLLNWYFAGGKGWSMTPLRSLPASCH